MLGLFVSLITLSLSTLLRHSEFKDSTIRQNQLLGLSRSRCSSAWSRWHIMLLEEGAAPECFECELKKKSALSRGKLSFVGSCRVRSRRSRGSRADVVDAAGHGHSGDDIRIRRPCLVVASEGCIGSS